MVLMIIIIIVSLYSIIMILPKLLHDDSRKYPEPSKGCVQNHKNKHLRLLSKIIIMEL